VKYVTDKRLFPPIANTGIRLASLGVVGLALGTILLIAVSGLRHIS
jgi:hypothetical protein